MRGAPFFHALLLALLLALAAPHSRAEDWRGVPVLEIPGAAAALSLAEAQAAAGAGAEARAAVEALARRYGSAGRPRAALALLAASAGAQEEAAALLLEAVERGYADAPRLLSGPPLMALAARPEIAALRDAPPPPAPAPPPPVGVDTGEAAISPSALGWDRERESLVARISVLPAMRRFPVVEPNSERPLPELQAWVNRGRAAGNVGDLYDNRDRGHSVLSPRNQLQMSRVVYGPEMRAAGLDYGLNTALLFGAPTIGNASTAVQGPFWRSQARLALTSPGGAARLWRLYEANHLYVFPEHRDHDPAVPAEGAAGPDRRPGFGDLMPANTPYFLVSQGSSRSDQPILVALRTILAALKPETKAFLTERGLIAPTLQQIFRRGQRGIGDAGYLTPAAHPPVFRAGDSDLGAMMAFANALEPGEAPPVVRLELRSASGAAGEAPGLGGATPGEETLFDTPAAIARVWRGAGFERRYILSAAATEDPNGRPLRFRWVLTQGRAEAVEIRPLNEAGSEAEIVVRWDAPAPTARRPDITSPRVDVAVFADNGAQLSAPSFFSVLRAAHEERVYEPGPGGAPRLASIRYQKQGAYADPLVWPARGWTDELVWAPSGRLEGWVRKRPRAETRFTAHGLLVRERDEQGRATLAEAVSYGFQQQNNRPPLVTETPTGRLFRYVYAGEADRVGQPAPID
ncbi:MAG: hypothetical protein ACE37J_12675 [Pikeienuella sp.]|uniref:hypothetical protein n=1 Tax=Pikeienuella sp. TaxID=2831957 RepID=UPI00391D9B37